MIKQSGFAQLPFLLIVVAGIAVAVFLVQYTQVFKSNAYSDEELAAYCEEIKDRNQPTEVTYESGPVSGAGLLLIPEEIINQGRLQVQNNVIVDTQSGAGVFVIDRDGTIRRNFDTPEETDTSYPYPQSERDYQEFQEE